LHLQTRDALATSDLQAIFSCSLAISADFRRFFVILADNPPFRPIFPVKSWHFGRHVVGGNSNKSAAACTPPPIARDIGGEVYFRTKMDFAS
jgi:hypothetical protein